MRLIHLNFICISLLLVSCSSNKSLEKQILGKWTMEEVYDGEQNVTSQHNPQKNRWIKFNRNGSFESGGDPFGYNDGNWEFNKEKSTLFLDSKTDDDDSEWKLSFQNDNTMIWTGIGTPRQEGFKLVHKRADI